MHLPSHKLKLRPNYAHVLQQSTNTLSSKTPEASAPAKTHNSLNIKDKRNIKIGIVALRTVSKWTDKAALTLEKLEGQDTSKHCQERQARLNAENGGSASGKETHETGVWRDTVVYPVPVWAGVSRAMEVRDEPTMYQESLVPGKEEVHDAVKVTEVPNGEAHHAHVLATVVEYHNGSSDDEDEGKACRKIDINSETDIHTDTDECSSDASSDEEEEDSEDENESPEDSDNGSDSEEEDNSDDAGEAEEEIQTKHPTSHVKK